MSFNDSVIFAGALVALVGAGILLGLAIGRRGKPIPHDPDKAEVYSELTASLDGLRGASDNHKRRFIELYYDTLMHGSDRVVQALNTYLQQSTAAEESFDPAATMTARDAVVLAMRRDVQASFGVRTKLYPKEMFSIEVTPSPVKPEPQGREITAPDPAAPPGQPKDELPPRPQFSYGETNESR